MGNATIKYTSHSLHQLTDQFSRHAVSLTKVYHKRLFQVCGNQVRYVTELLNAESILVFPPEQSVSRLRKIQTVHVHGVFQVMPHLARPYIINRCIVRCIKICMSTLRTYV